MKRVTQIEQGQMKDKIPVFKSGDTVKVHVKIKEGDKERVQVFQGTVIGRRGSGTGETFTVRKTTYGVGVERIFALHSPNISRIQRVRKGKVRQAKLFYLRDLTGKSARIEEKLEDNSIEKKKTSPEKKTKKASRKETKTESRKKTAAKAKPKTKEEPEVEIKEEVKAGEKTEK
ncbi:MAG: 50S ribosomal protein L19 [Candidatus Zixiibacteriota bacterium]|nr:MAG: 50S ribosomal protein L19 [candidate division Zixibacteria bacterium]